MEDQVKYEQKSVRARDLQPGVIWRHDGVSEIVTGVSESVDGQWSIISVMWDASHPVTVKASTLLYTMEPVVEVTDDLSEILHRLSVAHNENDRLKAVLRSIDKWAQGMRVTQNIVRDALLREGIRTDEVL